MTPAPHLNRGYEYRERVGRAAAGLSALEHLTRRYPHSSADEWRARLQGGEVTLDGRVADPGEPLREGQQLVWARPPWAEPPAPLHYGALYLDAHLLAVAKPSGLPTLPGGGFLEHTLLALVRREHPGASPLHRLGRATSGLVLFARSGQAAAAVLSAWRDHEVHKRYRALAGGWGEPGALSVTAPIGPVPHPRLGTVHAASRAGKPSRTDFAVLERRAGSVLLAADILTGRPHQIRIHAAAAGFPLLGDPLYAPGGGPLPALPGLPGDGGYHLHAHELRLRHPATGAALHLLAPPPPELRLSGERGGGETGGRETAGGEISGG